MVCTAATGFGKTLTFFMPLLFSPDSVIIIVTALNILGEQNVRQLAEVGISGIAVLCKVRNARDLQGAL